MFDSLWNAWLLKEYKLIRSISKFLLLFKTHRNLKLYFISLPYLNPLQCHSPQILFTNYNTNPIYLLTVIVSHHSNRIKNNPDFLFLLKMKKTNHPPPTASYLDFWKVLHKSSDRKFVSWLKETEIWGKENWITEGNREGRGIIKEEEKGGNVGLFMHSCPLQCQFITKKEEVCVQFFFTWLIQLEFWSSGKAEIRNSWKPVITSSVYLPTTYSPITLCGRAHVIGTSPSKT